MSRDNSPSGSRILSFLFAFTVLFIFVFGLGVFVGKRLGRQELRITREFNEAPPEQSIAPVEESPETGVEQIAESPPPGVEESIIESPAPPPVEDEKKVVENEAAVDKEAEKAKAPESTPAPAQVEPDERLAEITREIERDLDKNRAEEKKKTETETQTAKTTLPRVDPDGIYTVQIGSFQDQKQANSLANSLQSKGYPVFIKSMTAPDNKNWYRVRVGTFSSIESAKIGRASCRERVYVLV